MRRTTRLAVAAFTTSICCSIIACSGSDAGTTLSMSTTTAAAGGGTSMSATGSGGGSSDATGAGGGTGSGGTMVVDDASSGAGGVPTDASSADAPENGGAIRDRTTDRACPPSDADRCDTCTSSRCCVELDACDANATCKAAYAAIDACIGDSARTARERTCYDQFAMKDQRAKNLADCVIANCANPCNL